MFYRKIIKKLEQWKENKNTKAFILQGPRQTGKTYIIDWFCTKNFDSYVNINLLTNKFAKDTLKKCNNTLDILIAFSTIFTNKLIIGQTVIFIDEIQALPNLITYIKELVLDGSFKYILCGSLLEPLFRNIEDTIVEVAELHTLYPLSFEEFLLATNVSQDIIFLTKEKLKNESDLPETVLLSFMRYFKQFLIVGGMPSVIEKFIKFQNYEEVFLEQQRILTLYNKDFKKYETLDKKLHIQKLFSNIPTQAKKEYNRFSIKEFSNSRYEQIEKSIDYLITAGYAHKINLTNELIEGIKKSKRKMFKLYFLDIGLLICKEGRTTRNKIIIEDENYNFNYIYENFVCTQLLQNNYSLYYYNSRKHGEVKFVYENKTKTQITIVEIKQEKYYQNHNTLDYLNKTYQNINTSYVCCNHNIKKNNKILYIPIFLIGFLEDNKTD